MSKNTIKGKPTSNIYTSAWDWSDTVCNINSKWSIDFECSHPIIVSPFRIHIICLICKCYGNISNKTTIKMLKMLTFKMIKQMLLHTCFILSIFPIITFVIVPSKTEFIILLTTTLTCEKKNQRVIMTVEFMVYLKTFACCSARKCISFFNI